MMLSELLTGIDGQGIADDDPRRRHGQLFRATSAPPSWPSSTARRRARSCHRCAGSRCSQPTSAATRRIEHPDLPFNDPGASLAAQLAIREPNARETNPATAGFGLQQVADEVAAGTGVGEDADQSISPPPTSSCFRKTTGKSLGTYLSSPGLDDQPVEVDGHKYDLALRFKRIYHPVLAHAKDFRFDRYTGTNTPKNYSSLVVLRIRAQHRSRSADLDEQSAAVRGHDVLPGRVSIARPRSGTVLQVVTNPGWMTPYVACMLVATGMLAHFGMMLVRFLRRRATKPLQRAGRSATRAHDSPTAVAHLRAIWFPALIVALLRRLRRSARLRMPESQAERNADLRIRQAAARVPRPHQALRHARPQHAANPFRQAGSHRQAKEAGSPSYSTSRENAGHRLAARCDLRLRQVASDHRIFRIENLDLLDSLGLEPRDGFRYSLNDLKDEARRTQRQIELADSWPSSRTRQRSLFQSKVLELATSCNCYCCARPVVPSPPISTEPEQLDASLEQSRTVIARTPRTPCAARRAARRAHRPIGCR